MNAPVFTRPRWLPASKINGATIENALISDGCILNRATFRDSLLGIRSMVEEGSELKRTVMMGADYYEALNSRNVNTATGRPRIGVGRNTRIENAIIDKNARIGNNCVISPAGKPENMDNPLFYIRDGILVIPKNGWVPDGTVV
jgi:glucose-1-phosphate adenylyltransferase